MKQQKKVFENTPSNRMKMCILEHAVKFQECFRLSSLHHCPYVVGFGCARQERGQSQERDAVWEAEWQAPVGAQQARPPSASTSRWDKGEDTQGCKCQAEEFILNFDSA